MATPFLDWRDLLGDRPDPVVYGVGHDRELFAVVRSPKEKPLITAEGAIFPYLVAAVRGDNVRTLSVAERLDVSHVQPIGDDLLLANARCHWRQSGPEKNAVIVGWDGAQRSALTLGDGINDLNVTRAGEIWTSYFDEGVFGNLGWSRPGPRAIGAPGLVAFDESGDVRFAYQAGAADTDDICDAYATTITGDGAAWVYFHTQFPIVRVHGGEYRVWKYGVPGARALAIHRDYALLIGDYSNDALARVVHLQRNGVAKILHEFLVTDDDGEPMRQALAVGRGSDVLFFRNRRAHLLAEWWSAA